MTKCTAADLPARQPFHEHSIIVFAAMFATVTYLAISTRAVLNPDEVKYFIDFKRLVSVTLGGLIFWFTARAAFALENDQRAQTISTLQVSIIGIFGLLMAREAFDFAMSGEMAQRLGANVRWILMWIGYFAAAVAMFFAIEYRRDIVSLRTATVDAFAPKHVIQDATSATQQSELQSLLVLLHAQMGYESADPDLRQDSKLLDDCRTKIEQILIKIDNSKSH